MSRLPRLSVIIPSYNQGVFIERTISSIVEQGYPDLELILMDGGSTDSTMQIVERFRHHFAVIEHGPDKGQADAIFRGFAMATGQIMAWLNSDDTYAPMTLLKVGAYFRDNPSAQFVYGDYELIDAQDNVIAHKRQPEFNLGVVKYAFLTIPQMSAFWTRNLYLRSGGVDPSLRFAMDYDLFVKLGSLSAAVHLPGVIGRFRIHKDSKTANMEPIRQADDRLIQDRSCRWSPTQHPVRFWIARKYYLFVLIGLLAKNGTLSERVIARLSNGLKSLAS